MPVIVVQWIMKRAPVIPDGDVTDSPAKAALELWQNLMSEQMGQQAGTLLRCPSVEPGGVARTGVKRFAPSLRVRPHDRVAGLHGIGIHCLAFLGNARVARCRHLGIACRT